MPCVKGGKFPVWLPGRRSSSKYQPTGRRLYHSICFKMISAEGGGDVNVTGSLAERFRKKFGIDGPFLFYCGRIDPSKGCSEMLAAFLTWKVTNPLPHKLVLIGKAVMPIPNHPDILP